MSLPKRILVFWHATLLLAKGPEVLEIFDAVSWALQLSQSLFIW